MADDLAMARAALLERDASLDLGDRAPSAPSPGWGVIPKLNEDPPRKPAVPRSTRYALDWLTGAFAADERDSALLVLAVEEAPDEELDDLAAEYRRLAKRSGNFASHVSYHRYWQEAAIDYAEFFEQRNTLMPKAMELTKLRKSGATGAEEISNELAEKLGVFKPTPGLALEHGEGGGARLVVRVLTDIEDEEFLEAFSGAVRREWTEAPATRDRGLSITLELERVDRAMLTELYAGDEPPELHDEIDLSAHLAHFPEGALVLTTGARSTHAITGRFVAIGPAAITPRSLAHEFGHYLGFDDAYLRTFEGDPSDPLGVVFTEWTGLFDDIMGAPNQSAVTAGLIELLVAGYDIQAPADGASPDDGS